MAKLGIDISSHNGNIDLVALQDQIDFVIIRVGYGTKGTIDTKFRRNVTLCKELGIPVGFYWYSYALDPDGARAEAVAFIDAIADYVPEYGCWFDMEDADGYKKKHGMPDNDTLQDICYTFCNIVESAGYYTGIYASKSWFDNQLTGEKLARFDKWVAQWPTSHGKQIGLDVNPDSKSDYSLWQFTSEARFDGYHGNLDANYAYKDFLNPGSDIIPTPEPEPEPDPTPTGDLLELVAGVMQGEYGDGETRKKVLGTRYDEVQGFINYIYNTDTETLAKEVIDGKYGDGNIRKLVLGDKYNEVQDMVNRMLDSTPAPAPITKGSRIRFTGTRSYSGIHLASWTKNGIFDVIEISGDRIVIGKGTAVTAAVNIKDCEPV